MLKLKNIGIVISIFLIINFVYCYPSETNGENGESKEKTSDSSENESDEKDLGTVSPTEMEQLKEEILENQEKMAEIYGLPLTNSPEEVETFLKEEEKVYGSELPDKIEETFTDGGVFKNFVQFIELFDRINIENADKEDVVVEKSPEQMKKMKEELYELGNKVNLRYGLPPVPREDYNKVWKEKKEEYHRFFPHKVEQLITFLKENEEGQEITTVKEVSEVPTEASPSVTELPREEPPKDTFSVRNPKDKICILAKFYCTITIIYPGEDSEQNIEVTVPSSGHAKGKCGGPNRSLQILWEKFIFSLHFNKSSEDSWSATSVELTYDTAERLFDRAVNRGKVTARSKKVNLFETPMGKSYFCPGHEVILLYHKDNQVATVRMEKSHIQPYEVEDGKFSANYHCDQVVIGGPDDESFVPDETVPLAVGCTLALITLLILVGFSVHRAYNAAKVDYNTME